MTAIVKFKDVCPEKSYLICSRLPMICKKKQIGGDCLREKTGRMDIYVHNDCWNMEHKEDKN